MADDKKETTDTTIPDLAKLVAAMEARTGPDPLAVAKGFASEVYVKEQRIRELEAKLPRPGAVVLEGDDAKRWAEFNGLGKPDDVRKALAERATFAAENATLKRDGELRAVAEKAGVKFAVLRTLAAPTLAFGEGKAKGKDGKEAPVVTVKDGDAEPVPFEQYAAEKWGDFLPALKAEPTPEKPRPLPTPSRRETVFHPEPSPDTSARDALVASGRYARM